MPVQFEDYSIKVIGAIEDKSEEFLYTAAEMLQTQVSQISPVKTGQLAGSWDYRVNLAAKEAKVGSPIENALWNEFGTGEYAIGGNGRKGGWRYKDNEGKWHFTRGKRPRRTLQTAFTAKRGSIIALANRLFGELD